MTTSPTSSAFGVGSGGETPTTKVANWIIGSNVTLDDVSRELSEFQVKLVELSSLLQVIELQAGARKERIPDVETGSLKKYKRRFLLRRHKKDSSVGSSGTSGVGQR